MAKQTETALVKMDQSVEGWPEMAANPFPERDWYKRAGLEAVAPEFKEGAGEEVNMLRDEAERIERQWQEPHHLTTAINMSLATQIIWIPGPVSGSKVWLKVKPFHVVRGSIRHLVKAQVRGSEFPIWYPIAPRGRCDSSNNFFEEREPGPDGKARVVGKRETCKFYGCTNHPMMGVPHTIHQAYWFVRSIGEAFPDPSDPNHRASYIPQYENVQRQLDKYMQIDRRPLVHAWMMNRINFLQQREQEHKRRIGRGEAIAGR